MNDRSDWFRRKNGGQWYYLCIRSRACSEVGWVSKKRAEQHRAQLCCPLDTNYDPADLLKLFGVERLPEACSSRRGARHVQLPHAGVRAAATEPVSARLPRTSAGFPVENDVIDDVGATEQSIGGDLQQMPCSSWRSNPISSKEQQYSAERSQSLPDWDGVDDDVRYAGPLIDNCWERESCEVADSGCSGASISLDELGVVNTTPVRPDVEHDSRCGLEEPRYELLQSRLVSHMEKYSLCASKARRENSSSGWAQAAAKPVTNHDGAVLVRDYSYDQLSMYRHDVQSRKCANSHLASNAYGLMSNAPDSDPAGVENCYPPSVSAAMAVLGVPQ
jgi:hypothetical protein